MKLQYRAVESILTMLAVILFTSSVQAETFQRLLILPQTITIAGGGFDTLDTHCLDEFSHAPRGGATYAYAPSDLGSATVTVGSGPPLTLQQAIDAKKIRLEGFGNRGDNGTLQFADRFDKIGIVSLVPNAEVKISVPSPSIIAPNQDYPVDDLRNIYPHIIDETNSLMAMMSKETKNLRGQEELDTKRDILYSGQENILKLRQQNAAHELSTDELKRLSSIGIRTDESEFYNEIVKAGLGQDGKGGGGFCSCGLIRGRARSTHCILASDCLY
ncbi:hypothetical protein [Methylocella sp.]|uniref:hypothetical protein n=1 Tax=Methylocella sp. TaxID=1978226 RepID=UPI0035B27E0C